MDEAKGDKNVAIKGNPKKTRILRTLRKGKMDPRRKTVQGPLDEDRRVRGNKAGRNRVYLPVGHVSRTH